MGRLPGAKNKTRIEMTLSPWYGEKIKELRAGSGFETDTGFAKWLVQNTVQLLSGEREPNNQRLTDLRLRMEEALSTIDEPVNHE